MFLTNKLLAEVNDSTALKAFSDGRYFEASIMFERDIYYETDITEIAELKYCKSLCYKNLKEFDKSLEELNSINLYALSDTLFFNISYEQALLHFLKADYQQARWKLNELKQRSGDRTYPETLMLEILCCNSLHEWDEAKASWEKLLIFTELNIEDRNFYKKSVDSIYNNKNIPKIFSEKKAGNLSRFIPGSGQIYCGKVFEGSLNFLIHASLLAYSAYEFSNQYYLTGYLVGLGLLNKFYFGGIHRASTLAIQRNNDEILEFNEKSINLLGNVISESDHKLQLPIIPQ